METTIAFDVNDALKHYMSDPATIPTPEADGALLDCENDPEALSDNAVVNGVLNPIVDAVADTQDAILRSHVFDSLQFLLKCAPISPDPSCVIVIPSSSPCASASRPRAPDHADTPVLGRWPRPQDGARNSPASASARSSVQFCRRAPVSKLFAQSRYTSFLSAHSLSKILDLIASGLAAEADAVNHDIEAGEDNLQDLVAHHRQLLEVYGFLLQWTIAAVETKAAEKSHSSGAPARGRGKPRKDAATATGGKAWDSSAQLEATLATMCKVLGLKLGRVFLTTSERDTFIGLLTRPAYLVLESEQRTKSTSIRMHVFKVLCVAVKHHGHGYGALLPNALWDQRRLTRP